jgi:hypothetical protein
MPIIRFTIENFDINILGHKFSQKHKMYLKLLFKK